MAEWEEDMLVEVVTLVAVDITAASHSRKQGQFNLS